MRLIFLLYKDLLDFSLKLSFVQPRLITSDTSDRIGSMGQRLR